MEGSWQKPTFSKYRSVLEEAIEVFRSEIQECEQKLKELTSTLEQIAEIKKETRNDNVLEQK